MGSMYALGTRVLKDCISTSECAANSKMPRDLLKQLVDTMARVGSFCFPDVMAVVHDMERDSGVVPVESMGGMRKGVELVTALTSRLTWGMLHIMTCTMLPRDSVSRLRILREHAPTVSSCCQMYMV